jgi:hypothetical protein
MARRSSVVQVPAPPVLVDVHVQVIAGSRSSTAAIASSDGAVSSMIWGSDRAKIAHTTNICSPNETPAKQLRYAAFNLRSLPQPPPRLARAKFAPSTREPVGSGVAAR